MTVCSLTLQASPNNGSAVGCNAPPIILWVLLGLFYVTHVTTLLGLGYVNCVKLWFEHIDFIVTSITVNMKSCSHVDLSMLNYFKHITLYSNLYTRQHVLLTLF